MQTGTAMFKQHAVKALHIYRELTWRQTLRLLRMLSLQKFHYFTEVDLPSLSDSTCSRLSMKIWSCLLKSCLFSEHLPCPWSHLTQTKRKLRLRGVCQCVLLPTAASRNLAEYFISANMFLCQTCEAVASNFTGVKFSGFGIFFFYCFALPFFLHYNVNLPCIAHQKQACLPTTEQKPPLSELGCCHTFKLFIRILIDRNMII